MSISPSSDIVLDVVRAADPQRAAAALQKLKANANDPPDGTFAATVATGDAAGDMRASRAIARIADTAAKPVAKTPVDGYQALGGLVLQKAIEGMLPKASAATFGSGTAGSIWRSALAEQIANSVAASVFRRPHVVTPSDDARSARMTSGAAA